MENASVRRVRMMNNRPTLLLDGADTLPLIYALSDFPGADSRTYQAQKNIAAFRQAGINLVACDTNLLLGWYKAAEGDYDALRAELSYVLDANPDARIFLRLHLNPPYWWLRDHPDELIVYRTSEGDLPGVDNGDSDRLIRGDKDRLLRVSTASELWRREAGDRLRGFLKSLKNTPEGRALAAVQVAYGLNGEWHQLGTDVVPAMQTAFRRHLRALYADEAALQTAWNDPSVTFDTAPFHPETFQSGDDGLFRDPRLSRRIIDAQKFIQLNNAETIVHFCRIVKETMGEAMLAGAFYGYYIYTGGRNAPIGGHLMPEVLYNAKGIVDFISGPAPYAENRKIDAVPMQRGLLESSRLNGMLWLTEMDQAPEESLAWPGGGNPAKMNVSIAMLRRNILMPVLSGEGAWFYDHRVDFTNAGVYRKRGWWDNPRLMREIAALRDVIERRRRAPYRPAADVLFVYDTDQAYIRTDCTERQYEVYSSIMRCGVAADTIYLKDLDKCDIERYRLIVMTNAFLITPEQRALIARLTRGKQVIWLDAPGYCDGETLDCRHIAEITGMTVRRHAAENGYTLTRALGGETLTDNLGESGARFCIEDDQAETLGMFSDGAVCAARKGDQWYFASPLLSQAAVLPAVLASGAHRYCEGEGISVLADGEIVLLYASSAGEKTVRLRNGKTLTHTLPAYTALVLDAQTGAVLM